MAKRGRPTNTQKVLNQLSSGQVQKKTAIATDMFLPNHSGDHSSGIVNSTPTKDTDLVNKKYVDDYGCSPAGNTTEIQFNDAGSFGGDPNLVWDKTNNRLGINEATPEIELHVNGGAIFSNSALAFDQYKMVNIYYEENRNAANLYTALYYDYRVTCTANSSKAYRGHVGVARWESTHDLTGDGEIVGVQASVQTIGSGDVANAKCLIAKNSGSEVGGTGTIDNGYGLIIEDWWGAASVGTHGGGTINTLYGIYIEDLSAATTNYAVFLENDMGIYFRDSALSINSQINGHLDLNADISIDLNANVDMTNKLIINQRAAFLDEITITDYDADLFSADWMEFPESAVSTGWIDMTDNVGLWHMDNAWTDSSGEGNNGTATGATFTASSQLGSHAGSFNGTSNYVTVNDDATLDFTATESFSYSVWVKTLTGDSGKIIFSKLPTSSPYVGYYLYQSTGQTVYFYVRDSDDPSGIIAGVVLPTNEWHHLAGTVDRATDLMKVYLDGVFIDSADTSAVGDLSNSTDFTIGARGSQYWNGSIDELAIWDRTLSADEISNIYLQQKMAREGKAKGEIILTDAGDFAGWNGTIWKFF